jgi:HEPN domain-containing protein
MPDEAVLRENALEWLRFALEDLDYAKTGLQSQHLSAGVACFHAQQTAEKSIKAVLVLEGIYFPKIHDLEELAELLTVASVASLPAGLAWLSPFAVVHRYPGVGSGPSQQELEKAVQLAEKTLAWARAVVG